MKIYYLVGAREIMRMLGVSRQRVNQLTALADFPDPVSELEMGRVWDGWDVEDWAKAKGRTIQQPTTEPGD